MTTFTRTFGGQVISPTNVSYATYTQAASLVLQWPFQTPATGNVMAWQIDVGFTMAGLTLQLGDATLVSTGAAVLITNTNSFSFTVLGADGVTNLGSVAPGQSWYFYLINNTFTAGQWRAVQFGAGTSVANAASLAGAGLIAAVTQLNQHLIIVPKPGAYSPVVGDLATVLQGVGGSVVWTPGSAVTFGNGWFVYVINDGTGTLTWTPSGGQLIDNAATKVLQPTESCVIFSDGANFWSLGYGRAISTTVTGVSIDLTGTGTINLAANQVAAQVQDFTGTLTGNRLIQYGTGVGFWFVRNNTTGAGTVTYAVNGSDPGVAVAQGTFSILRSNGSNMAVAFSATSGTVTSVATTADLTGGPITTTGTLGLSTTGVIASTYGSSAAVPVLTISATGRITVATTAPLGTAAAATTGSAVGNVPVIGSDNNLTSLILGSTGDMKASIATTLAGWVLANGQTIGNAASGGTGRANADTVNLFTLLWNNWANAQAPVPGGRGANAAADFAANKTITLPNLSGVVMAGPGGSLSATVGTVGGAATSSTTVAVSVSGTVTVSSGPVSVTASGSITSASQPVNSTGGTTVSGVGDSVSVSGVTAAITSNGGNTLSGSGSSAAFSVVQPTMVVNHFVKL